MKTKREEEESTLMEESSSKRQKRDELDSTPSPAQIAFNNALLPLASYDDDDEEEEGEHNDRRLGNGNHGVNRTDQIDDSDHEEEDDEGGRSGHGTQGKRNRLVEIRRDCPYLDTVNRQVILFFSDGVLNFRIFFHLTSKNK